MHVLAVRRDHRHLQARNPDVSARHRRSVDEPEADALPRAEESRPVASRRRAVHQVRVRMSGYIGEIRRVHPISPHIQRSASGCLSSARGGPGRSPDRPLMKVVVSDRFFNFATRVQDSHRSSQRASRRLAVVGEGRARGSMDDGGPYRPRCS